MRYMCVCVCAWVGVNVYFTSLQDAPLPANMEHIMQALEAANREQRAQAQQAQASHVHISEGAFECKPLLHMLPRHVKTVCVEVVSCQPIARMQPHQFTISYTYLITHCGVPDL